MSEGRDLVAKQRYNLVVPPELNADVQRVAQDHNIPVPDLIRLFIKLGLIANDVWQKPNAALIIRENGEEREIELFPPEDDNTVRVWQDWGGN